MNSQWEYTNTKISREFNQQNYSSHLNDMGSQGWELVTVDTYADFGNKFGIMNNSYQKRIRRRLTHDTRDVQLKTLE